MLAPDWRWLLDRDDTPWYPSMRLFRQTTAGQWDDVFQRMTEAAGELASAQVGDVVSLNEFPPEKPHGRTAEGYPTYLIFRQRFADIQWKQTLHRIDSGHVPADPENLTQRDLEKIGDVNRMHENYLVTVSYVLHGQEVHENVPLTEFVTWRSKHVSIEAPAAWGGRPAAYLDRLERVFAICRPLGRYTPGFIQIFWICI